MRDGRSRPGDVAFDLFHEDPFQVAVEHTEKGVRVRAAAAAREAKPVRGPNGPIFKQ